MLMLLHDVVDYIIEYGYLIVDDNEDISKYDENTKYVTISLLGIEPLNNKIIYLLNYKQDDGSIIDVDYSVSYLDFIEWYNFQTMDN